MSSIVEFAIYVGLLAGGDGEEAAAASCGGSGESGKYSIEELLDKTQELVDTYEYQLAQKFCQRALEMEPDNVRALELTSSLLLEVRVSLWVRL